MPWKAGPPRYLPLKEGVSIMDQRGRCRDCNKNNVVINADEVCALCADQLVLPLPPVRGNRGRFVALYKRTKGDSAAGGDAG